MASMDAPSILNETTKSGPRGATLPLVGVLLALVASALDKGTVTATMPRAAAELNGFSKYAWTTTAELLASTIAMLVFAKLSDLYGRRRLYFISTLILVVGSLFCAAAGRLPVPLDGIDQLILARGLVGIGAGAIVALAFTFIADLYPAAGRGRYLGVLSVVYGIGALAGLRTGGWMTDHFSWRWAFLVDVPVGVIAIVSFRFTLPPVRRDVLRPSIDWAGIAALCGWLVPLMVAFTVAGTGNWSAPVVRALLIMSAVVLVAFCFVERRAREPLIFLDFFRNQRMTVGFVNLFFQGICVFSVTAFLPVFLQGGRGASAAESALVLSYWTVSVFMGNLTAGQAVSRTARYRLIATVGAGLGAVGLFLLSRVDVATTPFSLFLIVVLSGLGFGALTPTYEASVQNATVPEKMGVATGSTRFAYSMGGTIGPALLGSILLRAYRQRLDAAIPAGTPAALRQLLDDPLKLFLTRANLDASVSQIRDGKRLLADAMAAAHNGLLSSVQEMFLIASGIIAVSSFLNTLLADERSHSS
jgi:EmrB/QacA subfamily drug resistance transporter